MNKGRLVFDFDGTLADTIELIAKLISETLKTKLGVDVNYKDIIPLVGYPLPRIIEHFVPYELFKPYEQEFWSAADRLMRNKAELYEDAKLVIPKLYDRGYELIIYSGTPKEIIEDILGDYKKYFSIIKGGHGKYKGDFLLELTPKPKAYIGDFYVDMEIAQKAKVPFILVRRDHNEYIDYPVKINSLLDLLDLFP